MYLMAILAVVIAFLKPLENWRSEVGAVVTADLLAALTTNYRVIYKKALSEQAAAMSDYKTVSTIFNSTTDKESYNWLGDYPQLSEWKDKRSLRGLRDFDYTLTNKHYEVTIEVDRDTVRDDKYSLITPRVRGLAGSTLRYFNNKVFSQLDDGATLLAYDGTAMFADTRVIGSSGNIDNLVSGAYSGSAAEIRTALGVAIALMRNYQDDWGEPLNIVPDTVVCPPGMEILMKEALIPGVAGTVRPEMEYVKRIIVSPYCNLNAVDWYLLCTTMEVKPIIFQLRQGPTFESLDDPKSSWVFMNKTFVYGVDARFEVGYGDPRTAIKIVDA
jgi:phage major head subunit gpT-like protein